MIKYLKENLGLTYHEIAVELNRDERGIWGGYQRAARKMPRGFSIPDPEIEVPVSIFRDRRLSVLENLVMFLKESRKLKLVLIARLLRKKSTTVSTAYSRAKKKLARSAKTNGGDTKRMEKTIQEDKNNHGGENLA